MYLSVSSAIEPRDVIDKFEVGVAECGQFLHNEGDVLAQLASDALFTLLQALCQQVQVQAKTLFSLKLPFDHFFSLPFRMSMS